MSYDHNMVTIKMKSNIKGKLKNYISIISKMAEKLKIYNEWDSIMFIFHYPDPSDRLRLTSYDLNMVTMKMKSNI